MPPKKNGKDIQMLQRAKNCNEVELSHALNDAIASSALAVEVPKKHRVALPRTAPHQPRKAHQKRPSRRLSESSSSSSRDSSPEGRSPRRKSRQVLPNRSKWTDPPSSSSERYSSVEEVQLKRIRRRSSHSGRSKLTAQDGYQHLSRAKRREAHARKLTPPPRSPDRSNPSSLEKVQMGKGQLEEHANQESVIKRTNSSRKRIPESSNSSQKRTHPDHGSASRGSGSSKQNQVGETGSGNVTNEERSLALRDRMPGVDENPGQTHGVQALKERVEILQRKIKKLEKSKAESDDHALELSKKLEAFRGGNEFAKVQFTEVDLFDITTDDMDRLSDRATSDSMFVGLLLMALLGPDRLLNMSATGQRSRRFSKKLNADGSPAYPALEAVDRKLMMFLCDKVAERNQMRLGPSKITSIRAACTEKKVRGYVTQKLSNHKRSAHERSQQNEQQLADFE